MLHVLSSISTQLPQTCQLTVAQNSNWAISPTVNYQLNSSYNEIIEHSEIKSEWDEPTCHILLLNDNF